MRQKGFSGRNRTATVLAVDGKNCLVGGCGVGAAQSEWQAAGVSKESPGAAA